MTSGLLGFLSSLPCHFHGKVSRLLHVMLSLLRKFEKHITYIDIDIDIDIYVSILFIYLFSFFLLLFSFFHVCLFGLVCFVLFCFVLDFFFVVVFVCFVLKMRQFYSGQDEAPLAFLTAKVTGFK